MSISKVFTFVVLLSMFLHAEVKGITIGIAPHSSTRVILDSHQDLRVFLENYFHRPVQIATAKNFSEFAKRCNKGDLYDLVLTSPNLALIAQMKASYHPIMTYTKGLETVILSRDKDVLKNAKYPLKVVGLDTVSFVTLNAQDWLEKQGLKEGKEITYIYSSASDSAATILVNNGADMTILSLPNYSKLPEQIKQKVNVFYKSPAQPSRIYLAKDSNGITLKEWQVALKAFMNSQDGVRHLEATKLEGFRMLTPHELDNLKDIADKTLQRLDAE